MDKREYPILSASICTKKDPEISGQNLLREYKKYIESGSLTNKFIELQNQHKRQALLKWLCLIILTLFMLNKSLYLVGAVGIVFLFDDILNIIRQRRIRSYLKNIDPILYDVFGHKMFTYKYIKSVSYRQMIKSMSYLIKIIQKKKAFKPYA